MTSVQPVGPPPAKRGAVHIAFEASLIAKGVFAIFEIIGAVATYAVSQNALLQFAERIAVGGWLGHPRDAIADALIQWAESLSIGTRHFAALYLLSHGAVKLWLIVGLLRGKRSYYPIAIAVFALFIAYQLYRFAFTHSVWLIVLTALDIVVIALTALEYHNVRSTQDPRSTDAIR